jgi:hypothetical protein
LRSVACPTQCSLVLEVQGRVMAYLAAYDSMMGKVTQLHGEFEPAPTPTPCTCTTWPCCPSWGQGMAARLLHTRGRARNAGLQRSPGVDYRARGFWQHHGYVAYTLQDTAQRERLAAYGRDAVYMMRRLDSAPLLLSPRAPAP